MNALDPRLRALLSGKSLELRAKWLSRNKMRAHQARGT